MPRILPPLERKPWGLDYMYCQQVFRHRTPVYIRGGHIGLRKAHTVKKSLKNGWYYWERQWSPFFNKSTWLLIEVANRKRKVFLLTVPRRGWNPITSTPTIANHLMRKESITFLHQTEIKNRFSRNRPILSLSCTVFASADGSWKGVRECRGGGM